MTMRRSYVRTLARDDRGAITIIFAVAMAALIGAIALAIDLGSAYRVRSAIGGAADAAALGAAVSSNSNVSAAERRAIAQRYFAANFRSGMMNVTYNFDADVAYTETVDRITVEPRGFDVGTSFAQANDATRTAVPVSNRSRVQPSLNSAEQDYDIHFSFDVSSSMTHEIDGVRKIDQVEQAIENAVQRIATRYERSSAWIAINKWHQAAAMAFFCENNPDHSGFSKDLWDDKGECGPVFLRTDIIKEHGINRFNALYEDVDNDFDKDMFPWNHDFISGLKGLISCVYSLCQGDVGNFGGWLSLDDHGTCLGCGMMDTYYTAREAGREDKRLVLVILSDGVINSRYPEEEYSGHHNYYATLYGDMIRQTWDNIYQKCTNGQMTNAQMFPAGFSPLWRGPQAPVWCKHIDTESQDDKDVERQMLRALIGNAQAAHLCDRFKTVFAARKPQIWFIGYGEDFIEDGNIARDLAQYCASGPDKVLTVQNQAELEAAFQNIVTNVQQLRIVE